MKKILAVLLVMGFAASCNKDTGSIPVSELAGKKQLNVWIDKLSLRKAPGLDSDVIEYIPLGATVYYLEQSSELTSTVVIRCTSWTTNWLKVADSEGKVGWVYAAGVRDDPAEALPHPMRIVIAYYPKPREYYENVPDSDDVYAWMSGMMDGVETIVKERNHDFSAHIFYKAVYSGEAGCVALGDETYPAYYFDLTKYMSDEYSFSNGYGVFVIEEGKTPLFLPMDYVIEDPIDQYFGFNQ